MREPIGVIPNTISNHSQSKIIQRFSPGVIAAVLMIIGAALRVWQYAAGVSLWIDEIAVARNFIERPLGELMTTPLSFGQVAPLGFILVEKLAVSTFGGNDYALRLFPLLCSLAAMVVFWRIAQIVLSRTGAMVALALFATAAPLVIYSAQVKQYSGDVLVALWLLLLTLRSPATQWSHWQAVRIGAAGFVAVFFSHPAVFVVAGLATAFWLSDRPDKDSTRSGAIRPFMIVLVLWAVAAVTGALVGIASLTPGGQVFLPNFWARGFPPTSLYEALTTGWPWSTLRGLLNGPVGLVTLGYRYTTIVLFLMALGCLWIGRNRKRNLALIVAPIGATLVAAILRQYPFSDRLIIFLIPNFLLLIAAGIASASAQLARVSRPLATITALYCAGAGMWPIVRQPPPYGIEDAKPVLSYLRTQRMPDDFVYVYYRAWQAAQYYGPKYDLSEGDYFAGDCYHGYPRRYLEELDLFRGRPRVWLVIIHTLRNYEERDDIVAYLDTIGVRRDHFAAKSNYFRRRTAPAELFLYDLSDAELLRRASAETFEIKGRTSIDTSLPCSIHERPVRPSISREKNRP